MEAETDSYAMDRIAHEVLNTVAAISGRAQLTRRRIEKIEHLNRDHIAADLRSIEEQAARAGALVEAYRSIASGTPDRTTMVDAGCRPPGGLPR